jgi:hypothetical protein
MVCVSFQYLQKQRKVGQEIPTQMMKTIFAAVAKTIASLVCLFILLNVIALSIPAAPLDVSLYTDKDVTPLPDYAEYKTISTGEKSFIKYIDAKNPELKDPPVMLFLHVSRSISFT